MARVLKVQPQPDFSAVLTFADGTHQRVDLRPFITDGISAPLQDWDFFRQVGVDDGGGIYWPNGYDFCADFLWRETTVLPDQPVVAPARA